MDMVSLLRTLGGLGVVLGMLFGALWIVRRYDIKLPGRIGSSRQARVELVQRLSLDKRRTLTLIRRDGREHLLLLAPEGAILVEGNIGDERPAVAADADADRGAPPFSALLGDEPPPAAALPVALPLPLPLPVALPLPLPLPEAPAPTLRDVAEMLDVIIANRKNAALRAATPPAHARG